jgi:hypothetical protein
MAQLLASRGGSYRTDRQWSQCWKSTLDSKIQRELWTEKENERLEELIDNSDCRHRDDTPNWAVVTQEMAKSFPSEDGKHKNRHQCLTDWARV